MRALNQKHDVCRRLIPIRVDKYERGEFEGRAAARTRGPGRRVGATG